MKPVFPSKFWAGVALSSEHVILTVLLSILPLALIGGEVMRRFGLAIIFGIIIGTPSSICIASQILLFLGEDG